MIYAFIVHRNDIAVVHGKCVWERLGVLSYHPLSSANLNAHLGHLQGEWLSVFQGVVTTHCNRIAVDTASTSVIYAAFGH